MPDHADTDLIEHCADFAVRYGVNHMLDLIAGVHQAYAPLSTDEAVRIAYDMASVEPSAAPKLQ